MAKAWDQFYDLVLPDLPGLPPGAAADHFIKMAAIEFYERTLINQIWQTYNIVAGTANYQITTSPTNTAAARILIVKVSGKTLVQASNQQLEDHYGDQDWNALSGTPEFWQQWAPEYVLLTPNPSASITNGLRVLVATKPTEAATGIDDSDWREYRFAMAKIARRMAKETMKKPYSDGKGARDLAKEIDAEVGLFAFDRARGRGNAAFRTKTHWI